ncbi:23S rRNA (guanine(2445)-N(2))-methyltransferase [Saliniradius amylolyticus]|uniref:Ribosomal RNA large subunit methyltransferase K/L n=1 Tax=Saliniradius amylolyticus TaxID=2183582 RepID=A0A2S2E3R7_9ALTE|nr:bifunctional 23S rRNA (guanine(2069)-N(7))-methyltransferase RlmK/23S rRNA (guanine(2445)-N(2))-methyltransferase RlmL [Saliniradius amylolyticus]AWL11900.1 23S rRNA (guanine(2445)-N(2))-methyltransferase [Saliniradius amylolyticus]
MQPLILTTSKGLEELLKAEVERLCPEAEVAIKPGQVRLEAELADAYRLCLWSRLANRVLWVLEQGSADNKDQLYELAGRVNWGRHFDVDQKLVIDFVGTNRQIRNSQFGALTVKDAIVDQFMDLYEQRPSIDKQDPDIRLHCRLWRDQAIIALDLSGQSLHQRHYRQQTGEAPLKEHVAAAVLYRSGWADSGKPLADPMCGAGTLLIEAALMAANIAPGLARQRWGFDHWKNHNQSLWQSLRDHAVDQQREPAMVISGRDEDSQVVGFARQNAERAGVKHYVDIAQGDACEWVPDTEQPGYLVSNPPYGERLSELTALLPIFDRWGQHLKRHFADWHLALLSSNRDLLRQLKLRAHKEYSLYNGRLECQLALYRMDEANCQERIQGHNDFENRLKKNLNKLKGWLKSQDTNCYRVYDADLPEYNIAVDCYGDWAVVQEYAAPKNIPESKTRRRLMDALMVLPQVLNIEEDKLVLKVRQQQKGTEQYQKLAQEKDFIQVYENGARFWVNLKDYLDTGLFLDHRDTRQLVKSWSRGQHVLNLFAYTGSVSVQAALGGAKSVTTVDMSNTYLDWAKKNFRLNKLVGSAYQFERADCTQYLQSQKRQYDLIFIDPPSFSNSKRMDNTWDVQRDHLALLTDAKHSLSADGKIVFSNNLRGFKLDEKGLEQVGLRAENISAKTLPTDFKRQPKIHHCWVITHG